MALTQSQRLDRLERLLAVTPPPVYTSIPTAEAYATAPEVQPLSWCMAGMLLDWAEAEGHARDPDGDLAPLRIPDAGIAEAARRAVHGGRGFGESWWRKGSPFVFDFEMPEDRPPVYVPANVPVLSEYVAKFRSYAPGIPVGFWGGATPLGASISLADWAAGIKKSEHKDALAKHVEAFRPLLRSCDYVSVPAYVGEPQSAGVYLDAAAAMVEWARKQYGRPVWVWLTPCYPFAGVYGVEPALSAGDAARAWSVATTGEAVVVHPEPDWRTTTTVYGRYWS